jgi:hypothetical protein
LYVMQKVLRGHDNAALDTAITVANASSLLLLIVIAVHDRYAHATARRQTFVLEGVAAVVEELREKHMGAQVEVHVSRKGHRQPAALSLAHRAALVVLEEPFCSPWLAPVNVLCSAHFDAPVWLVDADSLVPCALVKPAACHRAYLFDAATKGLVGKRLAAPWVNAVLNPKGVGVVEPICMPFKPVQGHLSSITIEDLVAEMDVDHTVRQVMHTRGGSKEGYRRWTSFIGGGGLDTYAKRRNDALDPGGVSRLSAYLNMGMVSPLRIAREVNARESLVKGAKAGCAKYMQEFHVWRGVSYAFCYHHTPADASCVSLGMLPAWARTSLAHHAIDPRKRLVALPELCKGNSGDPVWDALQQSLVRDGELHNNARMGWGKAVIAWCRGPEDALNALMALNNTYALDGHSPPSVGGLMGCMGLFEGPKGDSLIYGAVQQRGVKRKYMALGKAKEKRGGQQALIFKTAVE